MFKEGQGGAMWSLELDTGLGSDPIASEAPQLNGQPIPRGFQSNTLVSRLE